MRPLALALIGWAICGAYAYGTTLAYFQREYPTLADKDRREDRALAIAFFFGGPCSAIVAFFESGFNKHGWML